MTRKLIEFFPELIKEAEEYMWALADFSPEHGKFVKIIGMAKRPDRLRDYAKGSKRVIRLNGEPAQVGYKMDRFKAAELVDEGREDDDSLAGAFARARKAPPYKSKGQGPPVKVRVTGITPILMMAGMAANAAASYGAEITQRLIGGFEATFPDTSSFNDYKSAMTMGHLEVVKDDYRPAASKNMGPAQQAAVQRRASKRTQPKPNPEIGK